MVGVEHDDLAAVLAVEAQVPHRLLDHAVRLAGDDEAVVGEADVQTLAAAAEREQHRAGTSDELMAPIATEPSNAATVRRNDSTSSWPSAMCRLTRAGITLASVVM